MKNLKSLLFAVLLFVLAGIANAQSVGINSTGSAPNSSAMLDVSSTSKGLLIPQVALSGSTDVATITTPATSLLIYNTATAGDVTPGYYYYNGAAWIRIGAGTVPVTSGGTGATDAAGARTNLGLGTAAQAITGTSEGNVPVLVANGKIPTSMLNVSGLAYKGNKDLSGNPTVTVETSGNYYIISVAGKETGSGLNFAIGDWMISNGTTWQQISNSSAISSVAGKTGMVTLSSGDLTDVSLTGNATGKVLAWNGTKWAPSTTSTGSVSSVAVSGGTTGLTSSGSPVTGSGTITLAGTLAVANGGTGTTTGSITGTTALTFAAGGSNQNITLTPSGTGYTLLNSNVGIGTSTPTSNLTVNGAANSFIELQSAGSTKGYFWWANPEGYLAVGPVGGGNSIIFKNNNVGIGTTSPAYKLDVFANVNAKYAAQILNNSSAGSGLSVIAGGNPGNGSNKLLSLKDGGSNEKFTVLDNGNVGIGTTTPSYLLTLNGSATTNPTIEIQYGGVTKGYLWYENGSDFIGVGRGSAANSITFKTSQLNYNSAYCNGTTWVDASDARLKRDIQPMSKYGLSTVMQLKPVTYYFKADKTNHPEVGFIAQEMQKIVPEVVSGKEGDLEKGETLGLSYGNLVPVLTKAIQEQQAEIEALKAQNAALTLKVEGFDLLKAEVENLKKAVFGSTTVKK